jgi:hypothetical protein
MKQIREITSDTLTWVQPHARERLFELRSGEGVVGSLRWVNRFGSLADAVAASGHWTFKRIGFFRPQITVREQGSEANLATFTPQWAGDGILQFSTDQCFRWTGKGFWRSRWSFTNVAGEPLVYFEPCDTLLKKSAAVKVAAEGLRVAELSLLILMGWYLMLLKSEDDAASAAVICVIS